jgi:hypothetical protein
MGEAVMSEANRLIGLLRRMQRHANNDRVLAMPSTVGHCRKAMAPDVCLGCQYHNPSSRFYLPCAVRPYGPPTDDTCPDQEPRP